MYCLLSSSSICLVRISEQYLLLGSYRPIKDFLSSIVVPSFNQGHFIDKTLKSIINQDYPNLELIIVDGGSSDSSVEVIKNYTNHIKWWVSEADDGQANAINKGMLHASGEILAWLNSDD